MTTMPGPILQHSVAANKFYPPRVNESQSVPRPAVLTERLGPEPFPGTIIIEAQAGQGKTTLVHQFLEQSRSRFAWYQVTREDRDPVFLLSALYLDFSRTLSGFSSPQLEAILQKGHVGPMDLQRCTNILLNDIDNVLDSDIHLVLDDLHFINDAELSCRFLDYLIDTAPPRLHFILVSRHPLNLKARAVKKNPNLVYLDNEDLAFALSEIEDLYATIFATHLSHEEAERILAITNGWIMGIVLTAKHLELSEKLLGAATVTALRRTIPGKALDRFILTFFQDEILSQIPQELHQPFVRLSFLDEIDIDLGCDCTNLGDLDVHLNRMVEQNFFVYPLDDNRRTFRFHHLFQEFLQSKGAQLLEQDEISEIYRMSATYYLEHDRIEKALQAMRNGEDYERMDELLQKKGLKLVSANRTVTILSTLQTIPEKTLFGFGWLTFFRGFAATDVEPQTTLPYLQTSLDRFITNDDNNGELMALSQIIYFHYAISGRYNAGSQLLNRARVLFESIHKTLPKEISIIVSRNLAAGFSFFNGQLELARHYAKRGCELADRVNSRNFIAASRFMLGTIELLAGDQRRARMEIEKSHQLVSDPLVGMNNRLALHILHLRELSMHGEIAAFLHHKSLMLQGVDEEIVLQTDAAPYLYVWSAIGLLSIDRNDEALDVIEQGMLISKTGSSEHMTSQFLQWRSFIRALAGDQSAALLDIERSTDLRAHAGGPFYLGYHCAVKGAVMALLDHFEEARENLNLAMKFAEQIPSPYIRLCALAYLCYTEIEDHAGQPVKPLLEELFELMTEAGFEYFWGWEPHCMLKVLGESVRLGVEPDRAQCLAQKRFGHFIEPGGKPVPMLVIRTLGKFSISLGGKDLFNIQDFSSAQRDFIGLLISSADQRISQDKVQLALWPDSPPDKASKTFYTLISRLRKALATKIDDPGRYINVEKNYVQLANTQVDSSDFMIASEAGLSFARKGLWWQAGNSFCEALSCWSKFTEPEHFGSEASLEHSDDIKNSMHRLCMTWAHYLVKHNRTDDAIALLERTGPLLMSEQDIVSYRYQLYLHGNKPLKAASLLDSYEDKLRYMDYTAEEAAGMRREIRSGG